FAVCYPASKAAMTQYLKGLHLALRHRGVAVTNVRFGFVDTKMADAPVRPLMISVDRAARVLWNAIEERPAIRTYPRTAGVAALALRGWIALRLALSRGPRRPSRLAAR
ncbi:MAG: SDR family NAD(P)-dependent oxidoreductase, partial [Planctomycetes bacterium]|nr:SDR family NAD(P)-dependent oxidoreductase [Planctomycetota bacterium]